MLHWLAFSSFDPRVLEAQNPTAPDRTMSIISTIVRHAEIRFHEAADVLQSHVGCFGVVTAEPQATIRVVPDGSTSISIQLENGHASGWMLRGPLVRPDERRFTSRTTLVGVRLRPGVAFLLSGIPADQTINRHLDLTEIDVFRELAASTPTTPMRVTSAPATPALATQALATVESATPAPAAPEPATPAPLQYIDALQRFLIARLANASVHAVVAKAVQEIEGEQGQSRISDVAARCGVSARHVNRLMRLWVGYGAKRFASIVRFQAALREIDHAPAQSGALLASETGHFDQSHLTLTVGRFAGDTPRRLATTAVSDFSKTRCEDTP